MGRFGLTGLAAAACLAVPADALANHAEPPRAHWPLGDWSRPRKDKFRATKRAHSRRHPFSELRRKP